MTEPSAAELPPSASPERPKVIYVMGAGRSGSTILGVALGNCANIFYAGELDKWLVRSGVPQLGGAERASFWEAVREDVAGAEDLFGGEAQRCLERSSALFRIREWPARRRLRPRYRRVTEELYRAIARATDEAHVVDTSHYPLRARELRTLGGIDLYLVFLVRNPQRVIASFDRRGLVVERRFGMLTTNAYLWLTYLVSMFVFLRHRSDRRLFLRHEDFAADPAGVLREILDTSDSSAAVPDLTHLNTGIPLQGNRLLEADVVSLDGTPAAPPRRSRVTALLQFPLAVALSRLRPAVKASASREHSSALQG